MADEKGTDAPPAPGEAEQLRQALFDIAKMPEYDQDDAHRLRYKAAVALGIQDQGTYGPYRGSGI